MTALLLTLSPTEFLIMAAVCAFVIGGGTMVIRALFASPESRELQRRQRPNLSYLEPGHGSTGPGAYRGDGTCASGTCIASRFGNITGAYQGNDGFNHSQAESRAHFEAVAFAEPTAYTDHRDIGSETTPGPAWADLPRNTEPEHVFTVAQQLQLPAGDEVVEGDWAWADGAKVER